LSSFQVRRLFESVQDRTSGPTQNSCNPIAGGNSERSRLPTAVGRVYSVGSPPSRSRRAATIPGHGEADDPTRFETADPPISSTAESTRRRPLPDSSPFEPPARRPSLSPGADPQLRSRRLDRGSEAGTIRVQEKGPKGIPIHARTSRHAGTT
jgi:hypothetical protein